LLVCNYYSRSGKLAAERKRETGYSMGHKTFLGLQVKYLATDFENNFKLCRSHCNSYKIKNE